MSTNQTPARNEGGTITTIRPCGMGHGEMHQMMDERIENLILKQLNAKKINKVELIQNLWGGYGQLNRVFLDKGSVIIKLISFPTESAHPRGWNSNLSHQRKVKSYQVEMNWYRDFNDQPGLAHTPKLISCGQEDPWQYLLLEDLKEDNFISKNSISDRELKQCLAWLANFHSFYLNKDPYELWQIGTYWHLETRPDELEALDDLALKNAASLIDQKLNQAQYKTIVHGDAKLANFLFKEDQVSAVDFQYVGGGVGIKDVAYFLSSIFNENELFTRESACLDYYFSHLKNDAVEKEWRELYPYAWCDFYRFLQGWAPGHPKINSYSEAMKEKVLACL